MASSYKRFGSELNCRASIIVLELISLALAVDYRMNTVMATKTTATTTTWLMRLLQEGVHGMKHILEEEEEWRLLTAEVSEMNDARMHSPP